MFGTVLVANRGEIALRVVRACRELGVRSTVVYSTADADSEAVRLADQAVRIGPGASKHSYLNVPAVLEAAHRVGADAVHPGYGFLSENPDFAETCAKEGIGFIGPRPAVIENLGDKATCRAIMSAAGLPLLPGTLEPVDTLAGAEAEAARIGWPLVVKAAAGGGGRGIGISWSAADLPRVYRDTRRTAAAVFGDGRVYVERYLEAARHVEVQILADEYGRVVHLGARDCSVQRRNQKLVEESPAPGLPPEILEAMTSAAVQGAEAAGYTGAGTFEFLFDPRSGAFYFMEVNCRVQVEHPVTEMVTSVDIVQEQIRLAAGEPLRLDPAAAVARGVSIECRINAEDPGRDFVPTAGEVGTVRWPGGPFVRVDSHVVSGSRVPVFYDSLLAKVIVWGPDRAAAIARMQRALGEIDLSGASMRTTTPFLSAVLDHPRFVAAEHDTGLAAQLLA